MYVGYVGLLRTHLTVVSSGINNVFKSLITINWIVLADVNMNKEWISPTSITLGNLSNSLRTKCAFGIYLVISV